MNSALYLTGALCWALLAGCATSGPASAAAQPREATGTLPVSAAPARLGAVGIGVSDLRAATAFYQAVLDLEILRTYELGYLNEVVLGYPGSAGAVLVLMHWPDDPEHKYDGTDVKNVFYVDDPGRVIQRIRDLGGSIEREATPHPAVGGTIVGLGRDLDNYVIEVIASH